MTSSKDFEPEPGTHQENVLKEQASFEHDNRVDRVPTVPLYEDGKVNLIPMPTDDPNGRYELFFLKLHHLIRRQILSIYLNGEHGPR